MVSGPEGKGLGGRMRLDECKHACMHVRERKDLARLRSQAWRRGARFTSLGSVGGHTLASRIRALRPPQGGFNADLGLKDLGHVRTLSRETYCPVPTTDTAFASLLAARAQFGPDVDWSAIVMAVRAAAGLPPTMA